MQITQRILKVLLRFRCPNCDLSCLDADLMKSHLPDCNKDNLEHDILDEIAQNESFVDQTQLTNLDQKNDTIDDVPEHEIKIEIVDDLEKLQSENSDEIANSINAEFHNESEQCDKTFQSFENEIQENHTAEKLHLCNFDGCDKSFKTKFQKTRHVRTHRKPYTCDWKNCGKTFSVIGNKKVHFKLHAGYRQQFLCQGCNRAFMSKSGVKKHEIHCPLVQ